MTEVPLREDEERFAFGKNWQSFLEGMDQQRIDVATQSMTALLGKNDLAGQTFLDIGSGSGLFSLAAHRLGAEVVSFDYDTDSVACTQSLRQRFGEQGRSWTVQQGSALDANFMAGLGTFDVVYSWGVLHHTGDMATGIALSAARVRSGGTLVLAIYNDQGSRSRLWWHIKRFYCRGKLPRIMVEAVFFPIFFLHNLVTDVFKRRWPGAFLRRYASQRGMSILHDWRDWLGGFPFEVATPSAMIETLESHGFTTTLTRSTSGLGCNEYVSSRHGPAAERRPPPIAYSP